MTEKLSPDARETLMEPRFSIKAPNAFSDRWVDRVPILTREADGRIKIAFPSYNTRPTRTGDDEAQRALDELHRLLDAVAIDIYIAPGEWLVWNNSTVVHRRGAIGEGRRKLYRNYIRRDCEAMRAATGSPGPIFSAQTLLEADTAQAEMRSHVA